MKNWQKKQKTIKLIHTTSGKTVWLDRPTEAFDAGHVNDETKSAWRMFNVYPNGFETEFSF